jgi:hypothetical protein
MEQQYWLYLAECYMHCGLIRKSKRIVEQSQKWKCSYKVSRCQPVLIVSVGDCVLNNANIDLVFLTALTHRKNNFSIIIQCIDCDHVIDFLEKVGIVEFIISK